MTDFNLKKFLVEQQILRVSDLARIAKEKYKLNPEFPDMEDRLKNPSNYKDDRRQQIINYFVSQAKDQGVDPMEVELLKSKLEKETVPGKSFTLIPDLKQNILRSTSVKPEVWKLNIETRGAPPGPARATATSRPLASLATPALIVPLYPANTFVTGMPVGSLFKITPN